MLIIIRRLLAALSFTLLSSAATWAGQPVQYIIFEGGGPDQGPGPDHELNVSALKARLGEVKNDAPRMYAYAVQQVRLLSRSTDFLKAEIQQHLQRAETNGVPVFFHLDAMYAWGADQESRPEDAPAIKYWNDPEMREWISFPNSPDRLPADVPRFWFNWGSWCTPSAVPALGSTKFVDFACQQLQQGVLQPLMETLQRWKTENKSHLFVGINVGWEIHLPSYPAHLTRRMPITASHPYHLRGLAMDASLPGKRTGYASLYWRGWNEARLAEEAQKQRLSRDALFNRLCYEVLHDYMEALAKTCHEHGLARQQVFTHIVALATVKEADTNHPPIWTGVNAYSTPGFTMDNKGGARYDLPRLIAEISNAAGSDGHHFGAVETYFKLGGKSYITDAPSYKKELDELFNHGALNKVIYGAFPLREASAPKPALQAIRQWLNERPAETNE